MAWRLVQSVVSAIILFAVAEVSQRIPRVGALLLTLPLVSILALILTWTRNHELLTVSRLAKETLVLVPLGMPLFLPLAFAERLGIGFWLALLIGLVTAAMTIGL